MRRLLPVTFVLALLALGCQQSRPTTDLTESATPTPAYARTNLDVPVSPQPKGIQDGGVLMRPHEYTHEFSDSLHIHFPDNPGRIAVPDYDCSSPTPDMEGACSPENR
jgi:hypothetical protein